jgi:uncharacterized protein (TIGR02217 family)
MAFLEIEFPRKLALMAIGGPGYSTNVNSGFSGYEQRNQNWSQARAQYTVSFENKTVAEWQAFEAMFHAARGKANAFRIFDPGDYSGLGQYIGTGDGTTTVFQLQKTYTFALSSYQVVRPVQKPITSLIPDYQGGALTDTVTIYDNGVRLLHSPGYHTLAGYDYTLDETTGLITFATAPVAGHILTADYQYHIPVRFDLDQLQKQFITGVNAPGGVLVTVTGIQLIEVRIKAGQAS